MNMALNLITFRGFARDKIKGLDINSPEVSNALDKGFQYLLAGGEVTINRAEDYLTGFRDGSYAKGEEISNTYIGPKGAGSD